MKDRQQHCYYKEYSFRVDFFFEMQMVLHQYLHGMDTCSAEALLSAGSRYPELAVQERNVDMYINAIKEEKLDENIVIEPLDKCGQVRYRTLFFLFQGGPHLLI